MELVIGTILSTGQTLDQVLDMSWDHIKFCSTAIMAHKSKMMEIVFEAVSVGLGGKKAKNKQKGRKPKKLTQEEKAQKESALIQGIKNMGFDI